MSSESEDPKKQKYRDFMSVLPLTIEVAGLPHAEHGKYFTEGQMEARATTIKAAYKVARQIIVDITK